MTFKNKRRWQTIRDYSLGWTLAFIYLSIVRGEGTRELGSVQFEFWDSIFTSLMMGPLFGAISGFSHVLMMEYGYKQVSLLKLIIIRAIYALLFLTSIILLAFVFYGNDMELLDFAFEPGSFAIYLYILSVDIFMFGLMQVSLYLGGNNLLKLLTGNFYTPKEEERIFMFLDLKSSTQHAERLGHIQYSKMIQDCFNDLGVVVENESEIYQYVGDEVILTWNLADGLRNENCLQAYYSFKAQLEKRKAYYQDQYGCQPQFKAGLNEGIVTITEVGKYKKEIAFHGDTINTAARIQEKCNDFREELLISENLKDKLVVSAFSFHKLDSIALKGKEQVVTIYSVTEVDQLK
ncbi:adenylate cyclase [Reichenbachiella faecimaris]|uniref:Adenylate cyclase n=1 Tax=Reichenbachiella faecimaris TaxID=692418 RepID=A0A1W2GDJ1_REIFA|nr:adenylate/guanylate cyclase domain-containing protein [Reichenbachiella faecimaris]SMD34661.1 adenylate cyclase [Reichenbachiella faecimaris]